ncbi:ABC transporter permease [Arthrobacter roseus]|uniref:ABC transporter permease n=1 Tax=Arthrobacter roseus TaxID=136274 RepID=UPI00196621C1|nr:ABC transporter permease [Arthrobacter roseus]MBM7849394.1 ABC-2 type transport system permease protein [Arthrobacter roseus]
MRVFLAGAVLQARLLWKSPFEMIILFTLPLQTAAFLSIFRFADRGDLDIYAIIAPALIALWSMALMISGEVIARERENQSLESLIASPAPLNLVLLGRISAVTVISMLGFVESILTGWLLFGVTLSVGSPWVLLLTIGTTAAATAGTAIMMSVVFIMSRSPRIFQNSLSYPFYLLGGILVPVTVFPVWLQWISHGVYLYWSADLLRDSVHADHVENWAGRTGMILLLGTLTFALASLLLHRTLLKARGEGKIGVL